MPKIEYDEIAKKSLQEYGLNHYELEFVGQSGNVIYRVSDKENMQQYSLRIHESRSQGQEEIWNSKESLESEVRWLDTLSSETDIAAPKPVLNRNNQLVTRVVYNNRDVNCTLLTWVEGEQKPYIVTPEDAGKIGALIGKLHRQSTKWSLPDGFLRPTFDENKLDSSIEIISKAIEQGILSKEGELLILAGQKARDIMIRIERTSDKWGLIHADLIPSNFIFHKDIVSPIDFGACGFGYYLLDLGWTFSYIHPALRESLLNSYSAIFPLPSNHEQLLETFFIIAQLDTLGFWLGLPDALEWLGGHVSKLVQREFGHYLQGQSFLFTGTPYWE